MNTCADAPRSGQCRGAVLSASPGRHPDSGLRLLVSGFGLVRLRWSTDSDAPAARALHAGELRLAIRCFELSADDLYRCRRRLAQARATAPGVAWSEIDVGGIAEVIESLAPGIDVGAHVFGQLHIGTHLVVRPDAVDDSGFESITTAGELGRQRRFDWATRPQACRGGSIEAVESAFAGLRDRAERSIAPCLLSLSPAPSSTCLDAPITDAPCF